MRLIDRYDLCDNCVAYRGSRLAERSDVPLIRIGMDYSHNIGFYAETMLPIVAIIKYD